MGVTVDWVAANSRRYPHAPALDDADTGRALTWAQLEDEVARTASTLVDLDVEAGDRIALLADNDIRFFVLQFAAMRVRAVLVPLNWRLSQSELEITAKDSTPALVVHDDPHAERAVALAEHVAARALGWTAAYDGEYDQRVAAAAALADPALRTLDDPTHILYTSGTTGVPKGALVTAQTLTWHLFNIADTDQVRGPGDRLLLPLPLFHAGGLNTLANPILAKGGRVSVTTRFDPAHCLRLLADAELGYSHFGAVPTMYQMMSDLPAFATARFDHIRHLQVAGGIASLQLLELWAEHGAELQVHYGGTEMGPAITAMPREHVRAKSGSCGYPVPLTRVRLVGADGREAAIGEVGEVWIQGPSVTPGYHDNPAATEAAFADGWFRTGDAARADEDGFLYLVDRLKDMYKSGGENVFPAEVERMLLEHPAIAEVTVVGVPDDKWGETGVAVVVARPGAAVGLAEVTAFCEGRLARYKLPRRVVQVAELPRNATGKVAKADLRSRLVAGDLDGG
ncbi:AMP-binding protein [uncultured Jatrophihabitans sp.]|uniref:AMP-binding protein n=1 Tax=uncultured Jatrophihabitans sp. TaxID=1610747 RepID=UPI0035CBD2F9